VAIGSDFDVYDIRQDRWLPQIKVEKSLPPRVAHAATVVGDELYLFGGRTTDKVELNDFWKFNLQTCEWTEISTLDCENVPAARSYHGMVAIGTKIYVFGGCGKGGRRNDLWAFDTIAGTWCELSSENAPSPRGGPGLTATETEIWVFYGFNEKELEDIFAFNIDQGTWQEVKTSGDVPTPRSVHSAVYLGEKQVFLWGGEGAPSEVGHEGAGVHFNDGFLLNLETNEWKKVDSSGAPEPRGWLASTSIPGGAAIFGGLGDDNNRTSELVLYYL